MPRSVGVDGINGKAMFTTSDGMSGMQGFIHSCETIGILQLVEVFAQYD